MIMQNNVLDCTNFMLLGRPWIQNDKEYHDWGTNIIIVQGNGMVKTIVITKHLNNQTKHPKVFICYDF